MIWHLHGHGALVCGAAWVLACLAIIRTLNRAVKGL